MRLISISFISVLLVPLVLKAQPQIGGGVCRDSTFSGTYHYLLGGTVLAGNQYVSYSELGKIVSDGSGRVSGSAHASIGGAIITYTMFGAYSVQPNCAGNMALTVGSQLSNFSFQLVNSGQGAILAFSSTSGVATGQAYRQSSSNFPAQCGLGTLSGGYGYQLVGTAYLSGNSYYYSQAGSATGDGRGNLNTTGVINVNGRALNSTAHGTYGLGSDCTGSAMLTDEYGATSYFISVAQDGQVLLFMQSDAGYALAGVGQPIFVAPSKAVVNAASFEPQSLAPGAIFSIFGRDLATDSGTVKVTVDGKDAPVLFKNSTQVNSQLPFDVSTNRAVSLSLTRDGVASNSSILYIRDAAPGIFTFPDNRAVVQNQDYSVNSPTNPARSGDIVTVYLTGAGAVSPAVPTGGLALPNPLSLVNSPYSFAIGGFRAAVSYFGLTPGFVGLYQANVTVPSIAPGSYSIVSTVAGVDSNGPLISIR